ncbi:MAG: UDP-N-acetylglucosamine diphosphorylase/glucosamine-1-phosphate N-acetyltransferase [Gammaproteobacteria bacterium]|nr:MAG: UDP-N-acetylglucosamine diphosphorylase/glucosamine-1-phosphate N-acetyltransferase [Gammaproteobacteria bacterium]RLA20574.1 MAG: UDP-N-acetylglucosamine diphosphorylase/glucosamine-1-phosphate N-acetyltransferase [Gammaproteobacteria bacterium]
MAIKTLILAAGKGTRMRSALPKVLHKIGECSLLEHVYKLTQALDSETVHIIYGHGGETLKESLPTLDANWVLQAEQLGTGHAVMQAERYINKEDNILILYGDVPLLAKGSVDKLLSLLSETALSLLTVNLENPTGYGRIVRTDDGKVLRIVEEKDADSSEKEIDEVNTGIMAVKGAELKRWLGQLDSNNAQNEYYLTDIIELAVKEGVEIATCQAGSEDEVLGVNNRAQLAYLERVFQNKAADELMEKGVAFRDPARFDIRGRLESVGQDVEIDINVIIEGNCSIGDRVKIGPNCIIKESVLGSDIEILANSHIDGTRIGNNSNVGPYARLRPGTVLAEGVRIGNFVETKKTTVGNGSKISHLSYIGDCEIGELVNIGAGTITCNYDGVNKFKTIIEDGVFVGSDTQLVAPVTLAKNTTIGAGSTITKNTVAESLTLSRSKQVTISSWKRPIKK